MSSVARGPLILRLPAARRWQRLPNAARILGLPTRLHRGEARRGAATQQLGIGYRDASLAAETREGLARDALRPGAGRAVRRRDPVRRVPGPGGVPRLA
ncbi:hypothetical protein [Streptomyces sp. NPDC017988]|uniref:hypothetical protein n=1 Tax=Streptomyces sp. NPDC017988 TaxID=3365025 RepID=UPI003790DDD6